MPHAKSESFARAYYGLVFNSEKTQIIIFLSKGSRTFIAAKFRLLGKDLDPTNCINHNNYGHKLQYRLDDTVGNSHS